MDGFLNEPVSRLDYLTAHVIFPPKLPQSDDTSTENTGALLDLVLASARTYVRVQPGHPKWDMFASAVEESCHVHRGDGFLTYEVLNALQSMANGPEAFRLFYLAAQNAAILTYQLENDDKFIVEAFEVSPENGQAVSVSGALIRSFPDCAARIPKGDFRDPNFQRHFARFLAQAASEEISDFMPVSQKANTKVGEIRNTVVPTLVTDMLITILEAHGEHLQVKKTFKRTHDDVLWDDARKPFRRSPLWLVLRVGLQRILCELFGDKDGLIHYKNVMALCVSKVCDSMTTQMVEPDLVTFASAKLARRLHKTQVEPLLEQHFEFVLQRSKGFVEESWEDTRASLTRHLPDLPLPIRPSSFELSMRHSGSHLRSLLHTQTSEAKQRNTSLKCPSRIKPTAEKIPSVDVSGLSAFDCQLHLYDFEEWVCIFLKQWSQVTELSPSSYRALAQCMSQYETAARNVYESKPEQMSVMMLTLMGLWCELDKRTVSLLPLLQRYRPEIPVDFLERLLVANPRDMERLKQIEQYLDSRHSAVSGSVFSDPHVNSFASKYFDQSGALQGLCDRILEADKKDVREKHEEMGRLKEEHQALTQSAEVQRHTQQQRFSHKARRVVPVHEPHNCAKCQLLEKAQNLTIQVHESPLPQNEVQRKAAVFALRTPLAFSIWCDTTWHIVQDLGRMQDRSGGDRCELRLHDYAALKRYGAQDQPAKRVLLASRTKSCLASHHCRGRWKVSDIGIDRVCVPNGLTYRTRDAQKDIWTGDQGRVCQINESFFLCPLPPNSPFEKFRWAFDKTGHTPNTVIAQRSFCPPDFKLEEIEAHLEVRSCVMLQWEVMLRELALSNIDFGTAESCILYVHAALQCGPRNVESSIRDVHLPLEEDPFCMQLIRQLTIRFESISANWRQRYCMNTVVVLVLRLILLSTCRRAIETAKALLKRIRSTLFGWTEALRHEMIDSSDESIRCKRKEDAMWAAVLCHKTYTVYAWTGHATRVEMFDMEDSYYWFSCSILLNNLVQAPLGEYPLLDRIELLNERRICFALEKSIRSAIHITSRPLDRAIDKVWPGERLYGTWEPLNCPNERWVASQTTEVKGEERANTSVIHYNILDGTLLIDGNLLGRLPSNFTSDAEYIRLFGKASRSKIYSTYVSDADLAKHTFEVYPTRLHGMNYSASSTFKGHQVYFGERSSKLCIRVIESNSFLELIPPSQFVWDGTDPDLPHSLINGCVHWLDVEVGVLEIRPLATCWRSDSNNWKISVRESKAYRGLDKLVDLRSDFHLATAAMFLDFEDSANILISSGPSDGATPAREEILVALPRYDLRFVVTAGGHLFSSELRAEIDKHQDIGTLIGLRSKLTARRKGGRFILVPRGAVRMHRSGTHAEIRVQSTGKRRVTYSKFDINTVLGRLNRSSELREVYYLAYLHAITSSGSSDPLTKRSGTEEAMDILKSGLALPWSPLDEDCISMLSAIAALTPCRKFYPRHLKVMQQVTWDQRLPTSAQHDEFAPAVEVIRSHSTRLAPFYPPVTGTSDEVNRGDGFLMERACKKNGRYWNTDLHLLPPSPPDDTCYKSRAQNSGPEASRRVYELASMAKNWSCNIEVSLSVIGDFERLNHIAGFHQDLDETSLAELLHLDLPSTWGSLFHTFSRMSRGLDRFRLMFIASTIIFITDSTSTMSMLRTLLSVAFESSLKAIVPPEWTTYRDFRKRVVFEDQQIYDLIAPCLSQFVRSVRVQLGLATEAEIELEDEREAAHDLIVANAKQNFASDVKAQWPSKVCDKRHIRGSECLDLDDALKRLQPGWLQRFQNHELSRFATKLERVLGQCTSRPIPALPRFRNIHDSGVPIHRTLASQPSLQDALQHVANPFQKTTGRSYVAPRTPAQQINVDSYATSEEDLQLRSIIENIGSNSIDKSYATALNQSLVAWTRYPRRMSHESPERTLVDIDSLVEEAQHTVNLKFSKLVALSQCSNIFRWLQYGQLWPRHTTATVLGLLSKNAGGLQDSQIWSAILELGLAVTNVQRYLRLREFRAMKKQVQFDEELCNSGHGNWNASDAPQWLLLEIESNLLIRDEQAQVARQIISPSSGRNSALQLNMGKGKSSVILPMVALVLADSQMLLRIIVPKPLLTQTSHTLRLRLGGLLGRVLFHIPFSRATPTNVSSTAAFRGLLESCRSRMGVLMSLPEHILSFKLSGFERISVGAMSEASAMLETQRWLNSVSRDVLDECDEILHPRQQLIYPSGKESLIDGSPNRWRTIQTVLELTKACLPDLLDTFPCGISIIERPNGAFPHVHIIREEVEDRMVETLAKRICSHASDILPVHKLSPEQLKTIRVFLLDLDCVDVGIRFVSESVRKTVLLLRGLLAYRVLPHALNKRWNVEYGLHPFRRLVSVPYRGKGVPSPSAEFAHSDLSILLTFLSYYYSGLSSSQFRASIMAVLCLDDPALEYDRWVDCHGSIPCHLRDHRAVNLEDGRQMEELHAHLRCTVATVNNFCNTTVFPKEAREFEKKLVTSAWDLPLTEAENRFFYPTQGSSMTRVTDLLSHQSVQTSVSTGFSGTNDFCKLLPLSIRQRDLEELVHTNAEVLVHLLQSRNRTYLCAAGSDGRKLATEGLMDLISERRPHLRILLDAGAQIMDMNNLDLVQYWLVKDQTAPAAIFFDETDKAMVVHRDGRQEALSTSSYASDSGRCLVYMDEPHCRGTDLKFPADARAALTVGPHQTKDHTTQAAMRMRQLAHSQSVLWLAPPEVHQSIVDLVKDGAGKVLSSFDAIYWLLEQTRQKIDRYQPLYISQGLDFCSRQTANELHSSGLDDPEMLKSLASMIERPEGRSLEELYSPRASSAVPAYRAPSESDDCAFYEVELMELRSNLKHVRFSPSNIHEEQERELAVEVEEERQIQRPPPATPLPHTLHQDVMNFVATGIVPVHAKGLKPAFAATERTALYKDLKDYRIGGTLLASVDFLNTVDTRAMENYQRSVQWILWSPSSSDCVIISPFEAEELLPNLKGQKNVHMIHYSAPVSKRTLHFNGLAFRSIPQLHQSWLPPTWLVQAIGLFAGRTFFSWSEVAHVCAFMNISAPSTAESTTLIEAFMEKPLPFTYRWTMLRRGADITYSPMGYLCDEKSLSKDHTFFRGEEQSPGDLS